MILNNPAVDSFARLSSKQAGPMRKSGSSLLRIVLTLTVTVQYLPSTVRLALRKEQDDLIVSQRYLRRNLAMQLLIKVVQYVYLAQDPMVANSKRHRYTHTRTHSGLSL